MKTACFDLEGPLSPQDNAYEVTGELEHGKELFEKISRYDDYLAQENRKNHEPGDTLALVAPFLLADDVTAQDIKKISSRAKIVSGARKLIQNLKNSGWDVYVISTSYQQHAYNISQKIGVEERNVYSTKLNLDKLSNNLNKILLDKIKKVKETILEKNYSKSLINYLDNFFFNELPKTEWGNPLERVNVRGGQRKIEAVKEVASTKNIELSKIAVIGDSITDYKMLDVIKKQGGKSIVFNGNKFAIPKASFSAASLDIRIIEPIIKSKTPKKMVKSWEKNQESISENITNMPTPFKKYGLEKVFDKNQVETPVINYIPNKSEKELNEIIQKHKFFRNNVRGEAAKLG